MCNVFSFSFAVDPVLKFLGQTTQFLTSGESEPPLGSGDIEIYPSATVTITPELSFINGKHELTLKPDTDQTQEARGDQFDTAIPPTEKIIPDDEIEILTEEAEVVTSSPETNESGSTTRSPIEPHFTTKGSESITTTEFPTKSSSQEMTSQPISFSMPKYEEGSGMRPTDDEEELTPLEGSADDMFPTTATNDPDVVATDETEIAETEKTTKSFGVDCSTKGPFVTTPESSTVERKMKPETEDFEGSTSTEDDGSGQDIYPTEEPKHPTLSPSFTVSSHSSTSSSTSSHPKDPRQPISLALHSTEPTIQVVSTPQTGAIPEESTPYIKHSENDQYRSTTESPLLVPEIEKGVNAIFTISEDISSGDQPTEAFSKQPFTATIIPSLRIQQTEEMSAGAHEESTKVFEGSAEDTTPLTFTSVQIQTKFTTQSSETTSLPTDGLRAVMSSSQETVLIQKTSSEDTTTPVKSSDTSEETTQEISLSTFGFSTEKPLTSSAPVPSRPSTSVPKDLYVQEPVQSSDRGNTSGSEDIVTTTKATTAVTFEANAIDYEDVAGSSIVEGQPPSREEFTTRKPEVWTEFSYTVENHMVDLQGTVSYNINFCNS